MADAAAAALNIVQGGGGHLPCAGQENALTAGILNGGSVAAAVVMLVVFATSNYVGADVNLIAAVADAEPVEAVIALLRHVAVEIAFSPAPVCLPFVFKIARR